MESKQEWFNRIYLKHRKRLLKAAGSMGASKEYAEDQVEVIFEKAYSKYETIKNHPSIGGWLWRTLENQIKSDSQKAYRHREVEMKPEYEPVAAPPDEKFMDILPPGLSESERLILYLHIEAGYSHEEIARMLGYSLIACRMRFSRAKRHCQKLLEEKMKKPCHIRQDSTNKEDRRCRDV